VQAILDRPHVRQDLRPAPEADAEEDDALDQDDEA
jgi:hypothetical protein